MDDDVIRQTVKSQYGAALAMLRAAITQCPDALWDDPTDTNRYWHVVYHALFYAHLYLAPSLEAFQPWAKHREESGSLSIAHAAPYSRDEVLEFLGVCAARVAEMVATLDFAAPSGFHWLPMNKLELQLYNIRHIQTHAGELAERLSQRAGIDVAWVSMGT
jgi:hypothetical protein